MAVVIETTLGDLTVDLFLAERPRASLNFLKLCKLKYYNFNLFHTIERGFIAQTGDPTGSRNGGESVYGVMEGPLKRYFDGEKQPKIKHTRMGLLSFVGNDDGMIGSQFFITLGEDLTYLDEKHIVFGEVMEGVDVLELLNETICDGDNRPYKDVRITHTVVLEDPFNDLKGMSIPEKSPSPSAERLQGGRIAADEDIDDAKGKNVEEVTEMLADREAKARATILEMVGDIPDADVAPPENVLFVCKLNPLTNDDDLEIIFSRFGKIVSCEVIRDKKSDDSLQYAFVEFDNPKSCEDAFFKMDNVLIDDRRIHVDFSQSVAKVKWHGKGRGITTFDDHGRKLKDGKNDLGKGIYKRRPLPNEKESAKKSKSKSPKPKKRSRSVEKKTESRKRSRSRSRSRTPVRRNYSSDRRGRVEYQNRDRDRGYNRFQRNRYVEDRRQHTNVRRRYENNRRYDQVERERNYRYSDDARTRRYYSYRNEVDRRYGQRSRSTSRPQRSRGRAHSSESSEHDHKKQPKKDSNKSMKKHSSSSSDSDPSSGEERRKKKAKKSKAKKQRPSSSSSD